MCEPEEFLLPIWDGMVRNYPVPTTDLIRFCRFDHGMSAVDVFKENSDDPFAWSVRFGKKLEQNCFHSVNLPAPCYSAPQVTTIYDNLLTPREKEIEQKILDLIPKKAKNLLTSKHKRLLERLIDNPTKPSSIWDPKYIKRYRKILLKMRRKSIKYPANRLNIVQILGCNTIIHAGGKKLNKIKKITLDRAWEVESVVKQLISNSVATFVDGGPILEIDTSSIPNDDAVHCAVRLDRACHVGKFSSNGNYETLGSITTEERFTCIKCSPLILGEFVYATESGTVTLRNVESNHDITRKIVSKDNSQPSEPWYGCLITSHPRCVIASSRNAVHLFDLRRHHDRSLTLLNFPSNFIDDDEEIFSINAYPSHNSLHLINTNSNVLLVDERFSNHPVLKWSHLLRQPPDLCRVHALPNDVDKIILVGSTEDQQTASIHALQDGNDISSIYSRCPSLRLPRPLDIIDELIKCGCRGIYPAVRRISSPFIGFDAISSPPSPQTTTIFKLTVAGDIFYENLFHLGDTRQDIPINPPKWNDDVIRELKDWIVINGHETSRDVRMSKHLVDGSNVARALEAKSGRRCKCCACTQKYPCGSLRPPLFETRNEVENLDDFGVEFIDAESFEDSMSTSMLQQWRQ